MRSALLVPILAAGVALSGTAFGAAQTEAQWMSNYRFRAAAQAPTKGDQQQQQNSQIQEELLLRTSPGNNNFGGPPATKAD
jgi:hypothetical protein